MKKIILIFLFLLLTQTKQLLGQPKLSKNLKTYYELSNKLSWAMYKNDYTTAVNLFKQLEQINKKPNFIDVQNIIKAYGRMGDKAEADKWIAYSISSFNTTTASYFRNNDYGLTKEDVLKMVCYANEKKLFKAFISPDKMETIITIRHLFENDVLFRNYFEQFYFDECIKDKANFAFEIATQFDTLYALPEILKIAAKYNFPDDYDIGHYNLDYFTFMLRHLLSNPSHKLMIDSALYNGKLNPRAYGSLTDYLYNQTYNPATRTLSPKNNYGFLLDKLPTGIMQLRYIDNIAEVDKRREAIGMMPLWQDAKVFNYTLSKQYIEHLKNNNIPFEE